MSTDPAAVSSKPACVLRLLSRLEDVAQSTEEAVPVGPYLVDALIDDVALCPALRQDGRAGAEAEDGLAIALQEARQAAALVRACPAMERGWAVARLRSAVEQGRRVLEVRTAAALDGCRNGGTGSTRESALKSERCSTCPFA